MNIVPAGDHARLIELDRDISAAELHDAARRLRARPGVLACVIGQSSLYVIFSDRAPDLNDFQSRGSASAIWPSSQPATPLAVSFREDYAPDLAEFLSRVQMSRTEFLDRVAGLQLVVRYLGFRGGFAYLDGWPAQWSMPRRLTSRRVERGSLAIAGAVAGFYPIDTPGGWNILGRTAEPLQYRLEPGQLLRIEPTLESITPAAAPGSAVSVPAGIVAPFLTRVRSPRWDNLQHGSPVGGPFDLQAAQAANLSVGRAADEELFEFAQIGPRVTPDGNVFLGWCDAAALRVERVRRDQTFDFGKIRNGLRGYLAVGQRPGLTRPLRRDDRFVIRAMAGPHDVGLARMECVVSPSLDRVGIRMTRVDRAAVRFAIPADLPSIGMQFGTLQLHPDGSIVAMGPDHPVTGGYLQPMTVLWEERWKLAHLASGDRVRFVAQ